MELYGKDVTMKIIGLTGGIGSGKSTVAKVLQEKFNAYLIFTDDVAKDLMSKGQISYKLTVDYFGQGILDETGEIDRKKLASIVFGDKEKLEKLNSFSHPYVEEFVQNKIKELKETNEYSIIVVETALLLEVGYERFCDDVWYVTAPEEVRRDRLKQSRGYSDEKIDSILKNQMSDEVFRKSCPHVLENNGPIDKIEQQIQVLLV